MSGAVAPAAWIRRHRVGILLATILACGAALRRLSAPWCTALPAAGAILSVWALASPGVLYLYRTLTPSTFDQAGKASRPIDDDGRAPASPAAADR